MPIPTGPLARLEARDGYRALFTDVDLWRPYVRYVCATHGLGRCAAVRVGVPGTFPTFIAGEHWVIKFFGQLFDGAQSLAAEQAAHTLATRSPAIPAPALIASGALHAEGCGWPWPYLVYEYVPGVALGQVYDHVSADDRLALARRMGEITRGLHSLPLDPAGPVFWPAWESFTALLAAQHAGCAERQRAWGALPPRLLDQIAAYLLPPEALVDATARPHLIHADLTADHVLGRLEGGRWSTMALIDFGDAMVGNLFYELAALHLDLFRGDKRMLAAYLDAYGLDAAQRAALPHCAMSAALLHRFDVMAGIFTRYPRAAAFETLDELATALWDIDSGATVLR